MSDPRVAVLDALVNKTIAEGIAAHSVDPALLSVIRAEAVKLLASAKLDEDSAQLVKEWHAARSNVVPFRPKAAKPEEAGA